MVEKRDVGDAAPGPGRLDDEPPGRGLDLGGGPAAELAPGLGRGGRFLRVRRLGPEKLLDLGLYPLERRLVGPAGGVEGGEGRAEQRGDLAVPGRRPFEGLLDLFAGPAGLGGLERRGPRRAAAGAP